MHTPIYDPNTGHNLTVNSIHLAKEIEKFLSIKTCNLWKLPLHVQLAIIAKARNRDLANIAGKGAN